ncbi:MAG: flagellar basal body P-ring formation protein FlgA, partial [Desulfobacteraceae bacterium]|nr:flagellar basal body P-ring formation protein FlgA [Desulfobacteraceae bacterium]
DKITLDDIIFLQKNIIGLKGNYATSVQNAADKITTTSVGTNEIIKTSILKAAPLIKKGDVVTLVAQKDKLSIMTKGICLEDGYRDKLIRVENIRSGRMIRGRVKEKSRVEIYY